MAPLLQGLIWTITILSLVFLSLRLYIKWNYRGKLWYDDYTLVGAMVLLLVNASLIQRIVVLGYGMHIEEILATMPSHIRLIVIYLQIISGVVRLSTNIARVSFAITLLRLSSEREKKFVWFSITTLLAVTTPAIILPFVSCRPYEKIFDYSIPGTCMSRAVSVGYFYFEGVYTALIDFALVALPWRILSRLQIRRVEKLGASLAMSLGFLSGVITLVKVVYLNQITDFDWTYASKDLAIWNMVEPAAAIIAASLPNLRVFIAKNTANLKASLRAGSNTRLRTRGNYQKTDDMYSENAQKTMKAITAGSDKRRGEATAWITARGEGDDNSERSILSDARPLPSSGIVQTSTFAIEYPEEVHLTSIREVR
ncbi:hypothetical protein ONZ43_g165 [Nemania bipapillata]|uniref:Uncharacterized protein n=1 Tax=Nemania bipapillata TaxID=110536 RepID=A0ACC2J9B0_9PEZI|nr:hypothetical protein ONZ43_g165 [Nemania bipapillata]